MGARALLARCVGRMRQRKLALAMAAWVAAHGAEATRLHAQRTLRAAVAAWRRAFGLGAGLAALAAWRLARRRSALRARQWRAIRVGVEVRVRLS